MHRPQVAAPRIRHPCRSQVVVFGRSNPPRSCLATATGLPRNQTDPGRRIPTALEVAGIALRHD